MSVYRMTLRFDLSRPEERRAVDFLHRLDHTWYASRNQFVIEAVLHHMEVKDSITLEQIRRVVREELQNVTLASAEQTDHTGSPMRLTKQQEQENIQSVLEDLELFG